MIENLFIYLNPKIFVQLDTEIIMHHAVRKRNCKVTDDGK